MPSDVTNILKTLSKGGQMPWQMHNEHVNEMVLQFTFKVINSNYKYYKGMY